MPEISFVKGDEIVFADQLQVLRPYFSDLCDEASLSTYFKGGRLGRPHTRLLYWQGQPAAHWSIFPFPFWIDGEQVTGGKPEAAGVHPKIAFRFPRPDLFGLLMDDLIEEARDSGWPLLVALTTPLSRNSHYKRGFVDVSMPVVDYFWPLHAQRSITYISTYPGGQLGSIQRIISNRAGRIAARFGTETLAFLPKMIDTFTISPYKLRQIGADELSNHAGVIEHNYWTESRLTVCRDVSFLQDRFRSTNRYEAVEVLSRKEGKPEGVILAMHEHGLFRVLDTIPPHLSLRPGLWVSLLRYARARGAHSVMARFYLNNPTHTMSARRIRRRIPVITHSGTAVYSVLALDPKLTFAYDSGSWAGTDMLMAGF